MEGEYVWPEKCEMDDIENYIDYNDSVSNLTPKYAVNFLKNIKDDSIFLNLGFRNSKQTKSSKFCGCLTLSDCHIFWNHKFNRYINMRELLMLQGFDTNFNIIVSRTQICKQIGNSMSVNVIKKVIENLTRLQN
jgi:site-specific DNA-cytosine methylase